MSTTTGSTTDSTTGSAADLSTHRSRAERPTVPAASVSSPPRGRGSSATGTPRTPAWEAGDKDVARRNLIWSVATEHIGFSIWSIWSVMVLFMPQAVYGFTAADEFFLVAVPTLVGAVLRVPYTMATAWFGGRNWAIISGFALLVPTTLTWWLMVNPGHSFTTFLLIAGLRVSAAATSPRR